MLDEMKRLALMCVGTLSVAEDEISATIAALRQTQSLSTDEGETILAAWRNRVTANRQEVEACVISAVRDALSGFGAPTHSELDVLTAQVSSLEARVEALEQKASSEKR